MSAREARPLIVGASLAGALTALHLARSGVRSTVFDARTAPRAKVCGEGLHPSGRALVEDLIGDISDLGFDLNGIEFFTPAGRLLGLDHPSSEVGLGCDRLLLDQRLWEALDQSPEVEFVPGETVRGLERSRSGWFVRTTSGVVPADRVIAADGVGSRLRWSTGRTRGRRYGRWGLRRRYGGATRTPTRVQVYFCGGGEIYVTPLAEGRINIAVLGDEKLVRGLQDPRQLSSFLAPVDVLRGSEPEGEISILPHRGRRSRVLCRDRLYLAGDAAIFLDPISGAGMSVAACSAHIIGTHLAAVLSGSCTDEESEARAELQLRSMVRPYRRMTRLLRILSASSTLRWGAVKFLKGAPKLRDRLARPTQHAWAREQVASI